MQIGMFVSERQWCDYMNYWRSDSGDKEQGHIRRIERDDGKIRELEEAAMLFWRETVNLYRTRTKKDFIVYPWDARPKPDDEPVMGSQFSDDYEPERSE